MTQPTRFYKVSMDWWILIPLTILFLALLGAIPIIFLLSIPVWQQIGACFIVVLTILYLVDTAFFTYYQLNPTGLLIISQLRHFDFPYRDMSEVTAIGIKGLFSFRTRKRFSLATHSYQITIRNHTWKYITISPAERDVFMNHLMEHVDKERSTRATK